MLNAERAPVPEIIFNHESEVPGHECGVYGQFSPDSNLSFFPAAITTTAIQNRGDEAFGGYVLNPQTGKFEGHKAPGSIPEVVADMPSDKVDRLADLRGNIAVTQVRWSTIYGLTLQEQVEAAQPYVKDSFAGAHNGNAENAISLALQRGIRLLDCPTDSIAVHKVVDHDAREMGGMVPSLTNLRSELEGAYSLVMSRDNRLYGMRDPNGIKPLSIGQKANGAILLASESVVFDAEGARFIRDVAPGEIVEISQGKNGPELTSYPMAEPADETFCSLEVGYFIRRNSLFRGLPGYYWREQLGKQLAQEVVIENPGDYIMVGVPESGLDAAKSLAEALGVNYVEALEKIEDVRSFLGVDEKAQQEAAGRKLAIDAELLFEALWDEEKNEMRRLIVVDDSVVRGNQMKKLIQRFEKLGIPRELIDVMIPFPELVDGCHLGSAIQKEGLLSYERQYEQKCAMLGVASLHYLSLAGFKKVVPRSCDGCFTGNYPIPPMRMEDVVSVGSLAVKS